MLTAEQIKAAAKLITDEVPAPEWGGSVLVKMLSGKEMSDFYRNHYNRPLETRMENYMARFAAICMCNPDGSQLFKDAEELGSLPSGGAVIERIYDRARKLNKMFVAEEEAQLKNSESTPSAAGP